MTTPASLSLSRWLLVGILLELLVFGYCYLTFAEPGEVFRHAARYSGRLSLLVYVLASGYFVVHYGRWTTSSREALRTITLTFSVMHVIHFGFLTTNIVLNEIELIPYKLAGGFLAYLMIVIYPWIMRRVRKNWIHVVYFSYVGLVMALTYLARIKGEFTGSTPSIVHYVGITLAAGSVVLLLAIVAIRRKSQEVSS